VLKYIDEYWMDKSMVGSGDGHLCKGAVRKGKITDWITMREAGFFTGGRAKKIIAWSYLLEFF
jgi:hypothetical protein